MAASHSRWGDPPNDRRNKSFKTMPDWMDVNGEFGETQFLVISTRNNNSTEEDPKETKVTPMPKNPFIFSKTIAQIGVKVDEAKPIENGNKYLLKLRNKQHVDKLLKLNQLIDGTSVLVEYHPTLNTSQRVVTCPGVAEMSTPELLSELASENVIRIYRFTKKVENKPIPTNTMVLTFKTSRPPPHVYFGAFRVATRPYYPKPLQCFGCGVYGHKKVQCKSKEICLNCGGNDCAKNECGNRPKCINCQGLHKTTDRNCPIFQEESEICKIKTDRKIPYFEAKREYSARTGATSFAGISKIQQRLEVSKESVAIEKKDLKIAQLEKQIEQLQKEIEMLNKTLNMDRKQNHQPMEEDVTSEAAASSEDETDSDTSNQKIMTPKRKMEKGSSEDQTTPTYYITKESRQKERKLKKLSKKQRNQTSENTKNIPLDVSSS